MQLDREKKHKTFTERQLKNILTNDGISETKGKNKFTLFIGIRWCLGEQRDARREVYNRLVICWKGWQSWRGGAPSCSSVIYWQSFVAVVRVAWAASTGVQHVIFASFSAAKWPSGSLLLSVGRERICESNARCSVTLRYHVVVVAAVIRAQFNW